MNVISFVAGAGLTLAWWQYTERHRNRTAHQEHQTTKSKKLNMSKAQHTAFMELVRSGKRETVQTRIYRAFIDGPKTVRAVAVWLNNQGLSPKPSTITARISELQDMGAIVEATEGVYRMCRTEAEQEAQREARLRDRKRRWVNEGVRNGWIRDPWADTTNEEIVESLL